MLRKLRVRLSYANVVATLALFLALGGGAAWAFHLPHNSVKSKNIVHSAIKSKDIAKDAIEGKDVNEATLEGVTAGNVLWAVVQNGPGAGNASLARAGQDGTAAAESGAGAVVTFPQDISACSWTATRGSADANAEPAGFAQTELGPAPTQVLVHTRDATGAAVDGDFHLVVVC